MRSLSTWAQSPPSCLSSSVKPCCDVQQSIRITQSIFRGEMGPSPKCGPCQNREESGRLSLWRRGSVDLRGQMCRRGAGNTVGVLLARGRSRQWLITITHSIDSLSLILLLYTHHRHVGGRKSKYSAGSSSVSPRCFSRYCRGGEGGGALQHFYIGKPTMGDGWVV